MKSRIFIYQNKVFFCNKILEIFLTLFHIKNIILQIIQNMDYI